MRKINKLLLSIITLLFMALVLVGCDSNKFNPNTKGAEYSKKDELKTDFSATDKMLTNDYEWKPEQEDFKANYGWAMQATKKIGIEKNDKGEDIVQNTDIYWNPQTKKYETKKITYPIRPKRVVSLFESHLNLAWEMGLRNIVGRNATSVKGVLHPEIENNKKIQIIGEGAVLASTEKLLALNPDLVLVDAMHTSQETKEKLLNAKIPFVELVSSNIPYYLRSAKLMAAIAGRADLFEKVAKEMVEDITTVKSIVKEHTTKNNLIKEGSNDNRVKVALTLLEAGSSAISLLGYNDRSANGGIIKTLQGRNLYEGKKNPNAQNPMFATRIPISNEELITFNPTIIFVQLHGEMNEDDIQKYIEFNIIKNPLYQNVDAVKNKKVYALPAKLFLYRPNKEYAKVYKYFAEKLFNGIKLPTLNCEK